MCASFKCSIFIYYFFSLFFLFIAENKSILTDNDWKKLWIEAGNLSPNSKNDNSLDSTSDSPTFEDTEVSAIYWIQLDIYNCVHIAYANLFLFIW